MALSLLRTMSRRQLILAAGDAVCTAAALYLAPLLYLDVYGRQPGAHIEYLAGKHWLLGAILLVHMFSFWLVDLYDLGRPQWGLRFAGSVAAAHVGAFLFLAGIFFFTRWYGRGVLVMHVVFLLSLVLMWRYSFLSVSGMLKRTKRVLIIGAGRGGKRTASVLADAVDGDYHVVGYVDDDPAKQGAVIAGQRVLGTTEDTDRLIDEKHVDQVVLAILGPKQPELVRRLVWLSQRGLYLTDGVRLCEELTGRIPCDQLTDMWFLNHHLGNHRFFQRRIKRLFDVVCACIGLLVGAVFVAIAAPLIRLTSRGPVFFRQERLGLFGSPFHIVKLRTMVENAEADTGPVMATIDDPRITPLGKMLRITRIDEIPQLWNVLKGDMSMVGPRPERAVFVKRFQQDIPFYRERLAVQPGLTGWSQVKYRYASSPDETRIKLEHDLYYVKNMSLALDCLILAMTLKTIVTGRGR